MYMLYKDFNIIKIINHYIAKNLLSDDWTSSLQL